MSQNTMTTIYTGLDIAKLNLQLHLAGRIHDLPNTAAGHRRLLKLLTIQPGAHVVCEATGGYERDVVAALHEASVPVSVLNPARVRHFARATGQRTKTDDIDAAVLSAYGQVLQPAPQEFFRPGFILAKLPGAGDIGHVANLGNVVTVEKLLLTPALTFVLSPGERI
jgi:transposase